MTRAAQTQTDPLPAAPGDRIDVRSAFPHVAATISICGASSNAGKTWLCERVIRGLRAEGRRVAALKVTRTHIGDCPRGVTTCGTCDSLAGSHELVRDRDRLHVPGKDTGRYVEAGADQVLWLLVRPASLREGLLAALGEVRAGCVLVAEGNSFRDYASADVALMALGPRNEVKPSASHVMDRIDAFVRPFRAPGQQGCDGAIGGRPLIRGGDAWDFVRSRIGIAGTRER